MFSKPHTTSLSSWAVRFLLLALLGSMAFSEASAQGTRIMPGQSYFHTMEELHSGHYRHAMRGMQSELNGAVRTIQARWIDSICYHTMLGEVLYQAGQNEPALEQFDRALLLFLDNSQWLKSISFQAGPKLDAQIANRLPKWALPQQATVYSRLPSSFLVMIGRIDNSKIAEEGGIIEQAQFWKLNAQEVARAITWSIYRRGSLLGSMAKHDGLQKRIVDTMSRGNLAPRGHWSNAWVELWWGLASASVGDGRSAMPHLRQSTYFPGRSHHALTSMSLMIQGIMAQHAGDPVAGQLLREAFSSAVAYEDFLVMGEVVQLLTVQDALAPGSFPPVDFITAANWARRGGLHHTAAQIDLQAVERLLMMNQPGPALKRLATTFNRRSETESGRLGAQGKFLAARGRAQLGDLAESSNLLNQALERQLKYSLKNFQIHSANLQLDDSSLSPRLAMEIFGQLLNDPSPFAWIQDPLDSMVSLRTDHTAALDRWFAVAVSRRDTLGAFALIDQQRRRNFFRNRSYAGRLDSMRRLLESDPKDLSPKERTARASLEDRIPFYAESRARGTDLMTEIRTLEHLFTDGGSPRADKKLFAAFDETLQVRETLLRQLALSRTWVPLTFPAPFDAKASRTKLKSNEALVVLHESRGEFYGLVLVEEDENLWRIGPTDEMEAKVIALLEKTAGLSKDQEWTYEMLTSQDWVKPAKEISTLLFEGSKIDGATLERLTIIPDGITWYLPFEVLPFGSETTSLIDLALVRISPTAGIALASPVEPPADQTTVMITDKQQDDAASRDPFESISGIKVLYPGKSIPNPVFKGAVDRLIVDIEASLKPGAAEELNPFPFARKQNGGLLVWGELPYRGPNAVAFPALHTEAELLPKFARRGTTKHRDENRLGDELFEATCSLMAGGARTVLLSRWQSEGERGRELVSEFLIGLSQEGASGAWQRSVALARSTPIVVEHEPRVVNPKDEGKTTPPDASHPFFWGGFLIVD